MDEERRAEFGIIGLVAQFDKILHGQPFCLLDGWFQIQFCIQNFGRRRFAGTENQAKDCTRFYVDTVDREFGCGLLHHHTIVYFSRTIHLKSTLRAWTDGSHLMLDITTKMFLLQCHDGRRCWYQLSIEASLRKLGRGIDLRDTRNSTTTDEENKGQIQDRRLL